MPFVNLYFAPALLLLVLACPQVSHSLPVTSKEPMNDSCVLYAWTLLHNITNALTQKNLFRGFDCAEQSMELNMETNTASVCSPQESTCSGIVKSKFDRESCLTNIGEDLHHYYKFLASQPDPDSLLGPTVLSSLRELMENCFRWSLPTDVASEEAAAELHQSTFDGRLSLCKVLKGFHVRTITINRVIVYMNSAEHTK
ncbi:interleukin-12 subunit alpha-like [Enoplosus armatus]|uniref:interleukin-12 subunit alpha-like n=1 Tax=Enoplosus armatus TaxID=215367 RepID=UPI003994A0AE